MGKTPSAEASYTSPGPDPFICVNCRYFRPGAGELGECKLVEGPYELGSVKASDACRFYVPNPAGVARPMRVRATGGTGEPDEGVSHGADRAVGDEDVEGPGQD